MFDEMEMIIITIKYIVTDFFQQFIAFCTCI